MSTEDIPRFNHVALSVPAELLGGDTAKDLLRFYDEVFGWGAMPGMLEEGELIVLRVHSNEQFVYLHAAPDPLTCPPMDHFGIQVNTPAALDAILDRATKFRETDDRVDITERQEQDFKAVVLHSFYVRYLLPLRVEVQCFQWGEGFDQFRTS